MNRCRRHSARPLLRLVLALSLCASTSALSACSEADTDDSSGAVTSADSTNANAGTGAGAGSNSSAGGPSSMGAGAGTAGSPGAATSGSTSNPGTSSANPGSGGTESNGVATAPPSMGDGPATPSGTASAQQSPADSSEASSETGSGGRGGAAGMVDQGMGGMPGDEITGMGGMPGDDTTGMGGAARDPDPVGDGPLLDASQSVRIMPFGDSIVEAQEWRSLLSSKLSSAGYSNVQFVGSRGDHEGHGGLLVTDVTQADLDGWITPNPADVVLFEIGTNDVWNGRDPSAILSAYELVMGAMRTVNPNVVILVAQITPMSPDDGTCSGCTCSECMDRTVALNGAIANWAPGFATADSPVIVVDQWTGFDVNADTSDRVHPNSTGAEKVAQNWFDAIASLY